MLILWQFSHFCFRHTKLDGLRAVSFVRVARENTDHSRMCRRQNQGDNELWTVYMSGGGSMLGANLHVFNTILMVIRRAEGGFRATRSPTNTWNEWTERKSFGVHDRFFLSSYSFESSGFRFIWFVFLLRWHDSLDSTNIYIYIHRWCHRWRPIASATLSHGTRRRSPSNRTDSIAHEVSRWNALLNNCCQTDKI